MAPEDGPSGAAGWETARKAAQCKEGRIPQSTREPSGEGSGVAQPSDLRPISGAESKLIRALGRRRERDRTGLVIVEGVRQVREAVGSGVPIRLVVTSPRLGEAGAGAELEASLRSTGVPVATASDAELARLSGTTTPQGILVVCRKKVTTWADLSGAHRLVALDAVQDPGNVGTLVRSAHAFGVDAVVALEGTADPWGLKATRSSAGSVFHVPVVLSTSRVLVDWASEHGLGLKVADAAGALRDHQAQAAAGVSAAATSEMGGWVLVVGNEGRGVGEELRSAAADIVSIATAGGAESLNAGVAGSILMYEFMKSTGGGQ